MHVNVTSFVWGSNWWEVLCYSHVPKTVQSGWQRVFHELACKFSDRNCSLFCCHTLPSSHVALPSPFYVHKEDLGSNISSCRASQIGNISTVHWIWCPFYHHSYQYTFLLHRYYHGPTPIQSQQYATSQDIINSFHSIRQEMEAYVPNLTQVCKNFSEILFLMLASYFCTVSCLLATGV